MEATELRKIALIDETVINKDGKKYITVYRLDSDTGSLVELTKKNTREYRQVLIQYPSLMKHAKKGVEKIWNLHE